MVEKMRVKKNKNVLFILLIITILFFEIFDFNMIHSGVDIISDVGTSQTSSSTGSANENDIIMLSNGSIVITWQNHNGDVKARWSHDNGQNWINSYTVNDIVSITTASQSSIARWNDDKFIVVFQADGTDYTKRNIVFNIWDGSAWIGATYLTTSNSYNYWTPDVAVNEDDELAYIVFDKDIYGHQIYMKTVNKTGGISPAETRISFDTLDYTFTGNPNKYPSIEISTDYEVAVAWEGSCDEMGSLRIYALNYEHSTINRVSSWVSYMPSMSLDSFDSMHFVYSSTHGVGTGVYLIYYVKCDLIDNVYEPQGDFLVSNDTYFEFENYDNRYGSIGLDFYDRIVVSWYGKDKNNYTDYNLYQRIKTSGNSDYDQDWEKNCTLVYDIYDVGRPNQFERSSSNKNEMSMNVIPFIFWRDYDFGRVTYGNNTFDEPIMLYYNTTIYDSNNDECGKWIFMGEVYNLISIVKNVTYFRLQMSDGLHIMNFYYNSSTNVFRTSSDYEVIGLLRGEYELLNETDKIMSLTWRFVLDKNVIDIIGTSITYYGENAPSNMTISGTAITELNIYNLGGYPVYEFIGDAGRVTGGEALEIWVKNHTVANTSIALARANIAFRRLQGVHFLWSLDVDDNDCFDIHEQTGYVKFGIEYLSGISTWSELISCKITIVNGAVDAGGGGGGKAFIVYTIDWYARDEYGNMTLIKTDYLTAYPECGDDVNSDITYARFFTDLWFNRMNSSKTIGGRVNSYYHGMDESGFLLWTGWSPVYANQTASMFFADLRDSSGDLIDCYNMEMIRMYAEVEKHSSGVGNGNCDNHMWSLRNYELLNWKLAEDRMGGIDTPAFVETKVIDMPQGGFVVPIVKAIESISTYVWGGALRFIRILISSFDSLLSWIGSPVLMSEMIEWVMIQTSQITSWMMHVISYASSMLQIFTQIITNVLSVIDVFINAMLWVLNNVVAFPINVLMFFVNVLQGGEVTYYTITIDFLPVSDLIDATITMAPIMIGIMYLSWIFYGNTGLEGEIDAGGIPNRALQTFKWLRDVYNTLFWVFNRMRNEIITLYNFIRSHIPSMGGGGGETSE